MDQYSILNVFNTVTTNSLSDEQKREIAKLMAAYLNSYDFALHIKAILARY